MAPKRQTKIENLPPSDSETEEEHSSDGEPEPLQPKPSIPDSDESEESSSDEESVQEKEPDTVPKATPPPAQTSLKSQSTEGSDSGSDSDSDSDSDPKPLNSPTASAFTVKPISSKPIPKSPEPKKKVAPKSTQPKGNSKSKVSNGNGEGGSVPDKKSAKRPAEKEETSKASRAKKSKVANGDEDIGSVEGKKSGGIGIVWSENDEVALLQGMVDYKKKKGADPHLNLSDFHEFVNGLLSVEVNRVKLSEKMRRLRKKYKINSEKQPKGKDPVFSKPHEQKSFELSKKIWGDESIVAEGAITEVSDGKVKSSRKKKDKKDDNLGSKSESKSAGNMEVVLEEEVKDEMEEDEEGMTDVLSLFPQLSKAIELEASNYVCAPKDTKEYAKEKIRSLGKDKARELEEGWKAIRLMEYELYAKRAGMVFKQTQAILDATKHSMS